MSDRITINFTANTREVERGADRMADSLGDVESSLDDIGNQGEKALRKTTDAVDDLNTKTSDTQGTVQDLGSAAQDALGGDFVSGATGAATSLLGLIGLGGTAGVLLTEVARAFNQSWQDNAAATEARVKTMYDDMLKSGQDFLSDSQIQQNVADIVNDTEKMKDLNTFAINSGIAITDLIAAEAGASEARSSVLSELNRQIEENVNLQESGTITSGDQLTIVEAQESKLQEILTHYGNIATEQDNVLGLVKQTRDVYEVVAQGTADEVLQRKEENELIQKRNKALADTPTTVPVKLEVDTSQLDNIVGKSIKVGFDVSNLRRIGVQVP